MTMPPDIDVLGVWRPSGCFSRISTEAPSSAPARAAAAPAPPNPMTTRSAERSQVSAIRPAPFTPWWAYAGKRSRRERQPGHVAEGDSGPEGGAAARIRRAEDAGHRVPGAEQPRYRRPFHPDDLRVLVDHRPALGAEPPRPHVVPDKRRVQNRGDSPVGQVALRLDVQLPGRLAAVEHRIGAFRRILIELRNLSLQAVRVDAQLLGQFAQGGRLGHPFRGAPVAAERLR